jgi:hypothetical protein
VSSTREVNGLRVHVPSIRLPDKVEVLRSVIAMEVLQSVSKLNPQPKLQLANHFTISEMLVIQLCRQQPFANGHSNVDLPV